MMNPQLPTLVEGDVIVPYQRDQYIMVFENGSQDPFIRARKHPKLDVWYSDTVDSERPQHQAHAKNGGLIVFVTATTIPLGNGIRVSRAFRSGLSGRGVLIPLPQDLTYPHDTDVSNLFKKLE